LEGKLKRSHYHTADAQERRRITEAVSAFLKSKGEVVFAFLHGSFVSDPFFRDIDVGVYVRCGLVSDPLSWELQISLELEALWDHLFPADAKIINKAPLSFRFHVLRGRFLFTQDEELMEDFMTHTMRSYLDMAPLRRRAIHEVLEG
jgi:hypothetical protein